MRKTIAGTLGVALVSAPAMAKVDLPPNVTTKQYSGGKNQVIDAIDYSFLPDKPIAFARAKMCIASNLTNDEVQLSDSSGSFVGAASGTYYQRGNKQTVQGGDIFKYVDEEAKSLVARGSISRQGGLGGIIQLAIRFDLEVTTDANNFRMRMMHIESAMKNTGSVSNNGFGPIGVWTGSPYKKNIKALDGVADQLKGCFKS